MILDFYKRKKKPLASPPPAPHARIHLNQLGEVGRYGEDKAAEYLFLHGYKIIERNIKYGKLEIDIIAENERYLVFAEVKTRTFYSDDSKYGPPSAAVNAKKKNNIKTKYDSKISLLAAILVFALPVFFKGLFKNIL